MVGSKIKDESIGKFMIYLTIKKVNNAENPSNIMNAYWYINPLWNFLAFNEHCFINDEIPSGPKPSIILRSKNFHKKIPKRFEDFTNKVS